MYEELRAHLDTLPVGYPSTESRVEIEILRELFEPIEAQIAMKLSFIPQKVKQIYRKLSNEDISLERLKDILQQMYSKGTIMRIKNKDETLYSNTMFVVGMYEYQLGRLTASLVSKIFQYFEEGYFEKEFNFTSIPQLRTIPTNEAITPDMTIATYDQLKTFIENASTIAIMDCICRKAHDLLNDPCKKTHLRETCMTFGEAARTFYEKGVARFITKEEAYELARIFEKEGLVPSPSNSKKPFVVCNCCGCCCEVISNQKRFKNPSQFFATNFYAEIHIDLCTSCGLCQERCNLDAITINNANSHIDLGSCIGCGLCISSCPSNAIQLRKKEEEIIPPENTLQTYKNILHKKNKLKNKS